jgi:hypothetical protein
MWMTSGWDPVDDVEVEGVIGKGHTRRESTKVKQARKKAEEGEEGHEKRESRMVKKVRKKKEDKRRAKKQPVLGFEYHAIPPSLLPAVFEPIPNSCMLSMLLNTAEKKN